MGGRFLGDPRSFVPIVPVWWTLSLLGALEESGAGWRTVAVNALANILAFGCLFAVLVGLRNTVWRSRDTRPLSPLIVVSSGALLGLMKVVISVSVSWVLIGSVSPVNTPPSRLIGGAIFGACLLPLLALLVGLRERFRMEREILVAELHTLQRSRSPVSGLPPVPDKRLKDLFSDIRQVITSQADHPDALRSALTWLIDKRLRPVTKEFWIGADKRVTDFSGKDLLAVFLARQTYLPGPTATVLIVVTLPYVLSVVETWEGIARVLITASLVWLVLHILQRLPTTTTTGSALMLGGALGVFTAANEIIAFGLFGRFGDISPVFTSSGNASLVALTSIVFGVSRVAWEDHQTVRDELKKYLGPRYWERHLASDHHRAHQRNIAEVLHGRVQNRLLGLILATDTSRASLSIDELLEDVNALEKALTDPQSPRDAHHELSLDEAFAKLAERWGGIIEVTYDQTGLGEIPPQVHDLVLQISEEAVTNAVRHGMATSIHIGINRHGQHLELEALDDGVGPRNGPPGVGTLSLQRGGAQSWSLSPRVGASGSLLQVTIPLENGSEHP